MLPISFNGLGVREGAFPGVVWHGGRGRRAGRGHLAVVLRPARDHRLDRRIDVPDWQLAQGAITNPTTETAGTSLSSGSSSDARSVSLLIAGRSFIIDPYRHSGKFSYGFFKHKAVIIGLDGATWTLLRPWIDQGHLPHLARLVHEGASGPLTTTIPPVSASAWVSFATGCNPGKHGAFDFVFPQPGGYDIGVINVQVRGVPPFWKTIEEAGGQVGLMSVPITYPPQPIHGFTVNGFLVPNEQSTYTYPPELKEELKRDGQRWPLHEFEGNRSRHPGRFLQDMLDFDVTRTDTIIWMMQHKPWDLLACVLKTPDTVHHEVWHIIDPTHPRYDAELNRQFAPAVLDYFKKIDDCVGRIIAAAPPDTFVAIMSDHGGGPFHKFFHVNNWLAQQGLLKFKRTPLSLFKHALFKLGFTPITSLKIVNFFKLGRLRRRVKRGRGRGMLKRLFLSFGDVDWTRTKAFAVGNFGQIYINVKGQRAQGTWNPARSMRPCGSRSSDRLWRCAIPTAAIK